MKGNARPVSARLPQLATTTLAVLMTGIVGVARPGQLAGANGVFPVPHPRVAAVATKPQVAPVKATPAASTRMWFEPISSSGDSGFVARGRGYMVRLTPTGAFMAWREGTPPHRSMLRMEFVGASSRARLEPIDPLSGKARYYIGKDPAEWRTDVPMYGKVRSANLYPGVDAVFYADAGGQLEYDLIVAPGADASTITLGFDGLDRLTIDRAGNLVLHVDGRDVIQHKPFIYQPVGDGRREIGGGWRLVGRDRVGFQIDAYDRSAPLVIDPAFVYSTYLGGSAYDVASDVAADIWGSTYVAGRTASTDFPSSVGGDPDPASADAFVAAFAPNGQPMWVTYLGGTSDDGAQAIAVSPTSGLVYVAGYTDSTNFPTTSGAFQESDPNATYFNGQLQSNSPDAFVTTLAWGWPVFSTYLGDTSTLHPGSETAYGIAFDQFGFSYVSGLTTSVAFPTTWDAFQSGLDTSEGPQNAFVTVLAPGLQGLMYSTYLGTGWEDAPRIAVDPMTLGLADGFVVGGRTMGKKFPTTGNAVQPNYGGVQDGFVTRFAPWRGSGSSSVTYSTFLGGSENDFVADVRTDRVGNVYATGGTASFDFRTTPGVFQQTAAFINVRGSHRAFVTKLDPTGATFIYSTYLGGTSHDYATGIAVDSQGLAYITGITQSSDFPLLAPVQPSHAGGSDDVFVTELDAAGQNLVFSTYLGGINQDWAEGIAVDSFTGLVYVTGYTASDNFPLVNGFWSAHVNDTDAFVTKIDTNFTNADMTVTASVSPDPVAVGDTVTYSIEVVNNGSAIATDLVVTYNGSGAQALGLANPSSGWCTQTASGGTCNLRWLDAGTAMVIRVEGTPTATGSISITASASANEPDPTTPNTATATATVR